MNKVIAVIRGDGIGPEIVEQALLVLDQTAKLFHHSFQYVDVTMGGHAIDLFGDPLPDEMLQKCLSADSVLLGAVGGPQWNAVAADKRPEAGLLRLRSAMGVYCNLRPAKIWSQLADISPLKHAKYGFDFVIIRELTGGIYFGEHKTESQNGELVASDVLTYSTSEIERIARIAFQTAMNRKNKLCSVEKSNVLASSRLWKSILHELAREYPQVELSDMLVDNCAMQIVKNPSQFDVIVTENMFGDILSDEASMITGSIGMIPSSSLGDSLRGLYEPIHGSAPDIAGLDLANPIGTILSAAMMLRDSFHLPHEAQAIERAVDCVLQEGYRTADLMPADPSAAAKYTQIGCRDCGSLICQSLSALL